MLGTGRATLSRLEAVLNQVVIRNALPKESGSLLRVQTQDRTSDFRSACSERPWARNTSNNVERPTSRAAAIR